MDVLRLAAGAARQDDDGPTRETRVEDERDDVAVTDPSRRRRTRRDPLWVRAWAVLPHRALEAGAAFTATAVATLIAVAAPLFVASVGNDVRQQQLEATAAGGGTHASLTLRGAAAPSDVHERFLDAVDAEVDSPWLEPPRLSVLGTAEGANTRLFHATSRGSNGCATG